MGSKKKEDSSSKREGKKEPMATRTRMVRQTTGRIQGSLPPRITRQLRCALVQAPAKLRRRSNGIQAQISRKGCAEAAAASKRHEDEWH
eukprot:515065-Rhodomonas_salina.3